MRRYEGKVVLVTGGGGGIGKAISLRLASEGAAIAVAERDVGRGKAVVAEIEAMGGRAQAIPCDVGVDAEIVSAVDSAERDVGPLDVVVSNVAFATRAGIDDTDPLDFDAEVGLTLRSPFVLAKATLPRMAARGRGVFAAIGSINGLMYFGNPLYSAGKSGLATLIRAIAMEYAPRGVRAVMVSPGTVQTDNPSWLKRVERDPKVFEKLAKFYPVGRVGRPDDIAAAIAYMASDEASFVNGAELVVDGGISVGSSVFIQTADKPG